MNAETAIAQRSNTSAAWLLERCGWDLRVADVDPEQGRARVTLSRLSDGLLVTLDVQNGRASVTRETRIAEAVAVGRRGDRFRAERVRYALLGRQRFPVLGARSAMRWLAMYLADNSPNPALARPAVCALLDESSSQGPLP